MASANNFSFPNRSASRPSPGRDGHSGHSSVSSSPRSPEARRPLKPEHGRFQHAPNRSRFGRFPVRTRDNDRRQESVSANASGHSPPGRVILRSPDVVPLKLGDVKRRSQSTSDASWSSRQSHRHAVILGRRPPHHEDTQSPDDGMFSHQVPAQQAAIPGPFATTGGQNSADLLLLLPIQRVQSQPAGHPLRIAQTVFMSVYRVHWLIQALASLMEYKSDFQQEIGDATHRVEELAQAIRIYKIASGQNMPHMLESTNLERACSAVLGSYAIICSHITRLSDYLVDNGDAQGISSLISLLHSSVMGLRAGLLEHMPASDDVDLTMKPRGTVSDGLYHSEGPSGLPPTVHDSLRSHTAGRADIQARSASPSSVVASESLRTSSAADHRNDPDEQFSSSVVDCCKLVLDVLPGFNARTSMKLKEAEQRNLSDNIVQACKSLHASCFNVIQQAASLEKTILQSPSLEYGGHLPRQVSDMCYSFIDSWIALGTQLQASQGIVRIPLETRKSLNVIQRSVKDITSKMNGVTYISATRSVRSERSSPSPSPTPMTPLKASLGPAAQAILPTSPL